MDIKIENADPRSSHPLVLDVVVKDEDGDVTATHVLATYVLKFGEFVIVQSLDGLKIVSFEEWTERQRAAEAEANMIFRQAEPG